MLRTFVSRTALRGGVRAASLPSVAARAPAVSPLLASRGYQTSLKRPQASAAPQQPNAPSPNDAFANTNNAYYVEEMHRRWKEDPASVHASWDVYFSGMENGIPSQDAFRPPPSLMPLPVDAPPVDVSGMSGAAVDDHLKVSFRLRASWRSSETQRCDHGAHCQYHCFARFPAHASNPAASAPRSRLPGARPPHRASRPSRHLEPRS